MAVVFPSMSPLNCFQDRTLYFSLLPRDILEYVLRPFFLHQVPRTLADERWIKPECLHRITLPFDWEDSNNLTILTNGNLLITNGEGKYLRMIDFATGQLLWEVNQLKMRGYMYHELEDVLMFRSGKEICHRIEGCSRIQTADQFHAACQESFSLEIFDLAAEEWKVTDVKNLQSDMKKAVELMNELPIKRKSIIAGWFAGGYMILARKDKRQHQKYAEFYRCLQ